MYAHHLLADYLLWQGIKLQSKVLPRLKENSAPMVRCFLRIKSSLRFCLTGYLFCMSKGIDNRLN
ncbi:hypothetical protein JCM19231_3266 [Vibrio ishigakensis]|uniref:Uncharacterized protein n=1 Tax=Vibrio ishigakensis TaxID=1481914 RepID=A0A0B8P423_9VIBR|nr:hypothetical protein JCM19231_3266 [Vibrio ishigakensis]